MNITKALYFSVFTLFSLSASSQQCDTVSFQNIYSFKNIQFSFALKGVSDNSGNLFFASNSNPENGNSSYTRRILVTKTTKRGTPLWSNLLEVSKKDLLSDYIATKDNGLLLSGSTTNNFSEGEGLIIKLDGSGNIQWSYSTGLPGSNITRCIQLANGNFAVLGVIPLDYTLNQYGEMINPKRTHLFSALFSSDGKILWQRQYYKVSENELPAEIMELMDHTLLIGEVLTTNSSSKTYLLKLSETDGNITESKTFDGTDCQKLFQLPDSTIRVYGSSNIMQLDDLLNLDWLKTVSFSGVNFNIPPQIVKLSTLSKNSIDTAYLFGNITHSSDYLPVLFKIVNFNQVEWAHTYNLQNPIGTTGFLFATVINANSFGICGPFTTINYSTNLNKNEEQTYFTQTNSQGEMQCSGNINMSYSSNNIPNSGGLVTNFTTMMLQSVSPIPVGISSLFAIQYIDCYTLNCCRDTVIHTDKTICENDTYPLPDGRSVNMPGIYTSTFHKVKGCDSIIVTQLAIKKRFIVSLPGDTCFINSSPILLKISSSDSSVNYLWQDGSKKDHYNVKTSGIYNVKVSNDCYSKTDSIKVYESCELPIYIPNAFTPNNDGRNDILKIGSMHGQQLINFTIYNRFGTRIFNTTDANIGWNGYYKNTPQPLDEYVYILTYIDLKGKKRVVKKTVMLIR